MSEWPPPKYVWNPKAVAANNKRWGVKLFHAGTSRCLRTSATERGDKPPRMYFPCEKCFPKPSKAYQQMMQDRR